MLGFKRLLASLAVLSALFWLGASTALAGGNPGRTPLPVGDITGTFCGASIGPVLLHVDLNKEYVKTYTLKDGTTKLEVNGRFIVDVTGNQHTVTFNAGGPGAVYLRPDGSVLVSGYGRVIFIGVNGEGIWLYNGNVLTDAITGLVISRTGHATDICALLS